MIRPIDVAPVNLNVTNLERAEEFTHAENQDRYVYFEDPDGNVLELVASTLPGYPQKYLRKEEGS